MRKPATIVFFLLTINAEVVFCQNINNPPVYDAKKVVDKLIRETTFDFSLSQQIPSSTFQTIDFSKELPGAYGEVCYAVSFIISQNDSIFNLGISHDTPLKIWVNGQILYSSENATDMYKEIAYDIYRFPKVVLLPLHRGENIILLKSIQSEANNVVQLAALDSSGYLQQQIVFSLKSFIKKDSVLQRWLLIGPFRNDSNDAEPLFSKAFPPELKILPMYRARKKVYVWQLPKIQLELNDIIPANASFKQHSYFEWHYANGQTTLAVLALADATHEKKYSDFVMKYCEETLDTYDYFRNQYELLHNRTGFNYRLFRKSMLDDTSAPILPFIELYLREVLPESRTLIDTVAQFVTNRQMRLSDGTLCRMEPESFTVWADDLFMSVPFLLRYGKMTGEEKYYNDAALQIIKFNRYLFDSKTGLSSHCWYERQKKQGVAHWGRANGWMLWAISEALTILPESHKDYKKIQNIFQQQIKGLVQYQDVDGMWHQVLDHPESFKETSCSAMFVLSIARGVRNGWINKKYKHNAVLGWDGIKRQIAEDGTVSGICQGTGIGETLEFYFRRKTPKHDPRGLGSVIAAGVEMQLLLDAQ